MEKKTEKIGIVSSATESSHYTNAPLVWDHSIYVLIVPCQCKILLKLQFFFINLFRKTLHQTTEKVVPTKSKPESSYFKACLCWGFDDEVEKSQLSIVPSFCISIWCFSIWKEKRKNELIFLVNLHLKPFRWGRNSELLFQLNTCKQSNCFIIHSSILKQHIKQSHSNSRFKSQSSTKNYTF